MSIGERIAEERKRLGFTQLAFAEKLGISISSQKRYETNDRAPNIYYISAIADIGADIGYVMTGSRNMRKHLAFAVDLDKRTSESLALAALDLDTESFAEAVSTIPDDRKNDSNAVLDALINNSPPLLERLGPQNRKSSSAKKRIVK